MQKDHSTHVHVDTSRDTQKRCSRRPYSPSPKAQRARDSLSPATPLHFLHNALALHSLPSLPPLDIPQDARLLPLKVLLVNQILAQKLLELLQPLPPPS